MDEAEHCELDESDVESAMPPRDLLQTAREILARSVTQQELAKAWDRSNHLPSEEQRVAACLERLLANGDDGLQPVARQHEAPLPAVAQASVQAPLRKASNPVATPPPPPSSKRSIIDLSEVSPVIVTKAGTSARDKKRAREENTNGFIVDIDQPPSKVKKTTSQAQPEPINVPDDDPEVVPDWLLQRFAEVAAVPGPAPVAASAEARTAGPPSPEALRRGVSADEEALPQNVPLPAEPEVQSPLAQVLAIIPDVDPKHAQKLIAEHSVDPATCVEQVIDALFANQSYPKTQASGSDKDKGKEKADGEDDSHQKLKAYLDKDTRVRTEGIPSAVYREAALEYLFEEFSALPLPFIRNVYASNDFFWAPAFVDLTRMSTGHTTPSYKPLGKPRKSKGKGAALPQDAMLTSERDCYAQKVARDKAEEEAKEAAARQEEEEIAQGCVFECGCCFDEAGMSRAIQCMEAHLFCIDCARKNAEHTLGNRGCDITCMHQDGCTAPFSDDVLSTFLNTPQILLLEKIRSEKAVEAAGLAGMSFCPHCSFGYVIDNPDEKLFYCLNEECKKITCRQCQKKNHLPKSCQEYAADLKTDTVHRVEEAMTEALLKRCPKCATAILKEDGCNKMRCLKCNILFCYVCSKQIAGYKHFDQRTNPPATSSTQPLKCRLWDDTRTKEYEEVEAARKHAIAEIREEKGDPDAIVTDEDLEKLGLKKPEARRPGVYVAPAPVAHNYAPGANYHYRYRYPLPVPRPGVAAADQAEEIALINGHNAILDAVQGDWNRYLAEFERIRARIAQGDPFLGAGAAEEAARVYARYHRTYPERRVGALPAPVLMYLPREQQAPIAAPMPQVPPPFPAPVAVPAAPAIPAPRARRVGRRARA